jgi:hypothetical protein
MDKHHKYLQGKSFGKISPYLQEKMVYLGQLTNYEEGVSIIKRFYGMEISQTQHFRLTNHYGKQAESLFEEDDMPKKDISEDETVYAQCDGSMILTREKKEGEHSGNWEEVKLCRVYHSSAKLNSGKRSWLETSQYVAHLGSHQVFKEKAEKLLDGYEHLGKRLVFISDGASWMHKWQTESYPQATQILDYYHACEHLSEFAQAAISDESARITWMKARKDELIESKMEQVIMEIEALSKDKSKKVTKEADKLVSYYRKNKDRMDYATYISRDLQIGSGAIEAAHRNVIQKRMKQSGQRWTRKRAQYVLDLRTCFMSGKWTNVVNLIRNSAA